MNTAEILGQNLRELRRKHGYTQVELSKMVGIAQTTYANYETGRYEPSLDMLIHLAEIYCTSLDYMVGRYRMRNRD